MRYRNSSDIEIESKLHKLAIALSQSKNMASRLEYRSLADEEDRERASDEDSALLGGEFEDGPQVPFSWIEYGIFCFLGMAMLWAW